MPADAHARPVRDSRADYVDSVGNERLTITPSDLETGPAAAREPTQCVVAANALGLVTDVDAAIGRLKRRRGASIIGCEGTPE